MAQTQVSGTVISSEDGSPIVGASIKIVGTNTGTVTDVNGKYSLTLPAGKSAVRVSYVGMMGKTVTVKGGKTNITLDPEMYIAATLWQCATAIRQTNG